MNKTLSFRQYNQNIPCWEVVTINLITGEFNQFHYSIINCKDNTQYLLTFGNYNTNTTKLGYEKPKQWLKRGKELGYEQFLLSELDQYKKWNPDIIPKEERERLATSI